jgi:hypothetical protein
VPAAGEVSVDEHANGTTVDLSVGQTLLLQLHSTYWQDVTSSDPSTLRAMSPTVTPQPASSSCPPGGGCGSITVQFVALGPGTATVAASRQLCGEDVQCPSSDRSYTLLVKIAG